MSVCKERPATLPPLDAIGLEPVKHTHPMTRGGSGQHLIRIDTMRIFCATHKASRYYVFHGVPRLLLLACALSFSLAHWLFAAPTLPDFDLRRIELDINDRT